MNELTNPAFIAAVATLVTAITSLVKVFHVEAQAKVTQSTLETVNKNTNGTLQEVKADVARLAATQATQSEMEARPK